jgi:hypothetical protein
LPTTGHLIQVARQLKKDLHGKAFLTIPRMQITQKLRDASGEDTTRIKANLASELELKMLEQGVRCFPSLQETSTGDTVRIFHAGTLLGTLVDMVAHPNVDDDSDLADVLTKIKGKWKTIPVGPPEGEIP